MSTHAGEWQEIGFRHATEEEERRQIREWMKADGHWSGSGKHIQSSQITRFKIHARDDDILGGGSYGYVQKITYGAVTLAAKRIRRNPRINIELLRKEARIMENLVHHHIVTLVGTYTRNQWFVLLMHPVAQCDLQAFLADIDNVQLQGKYDVVDTRKHFENLGFTERDTADTEVPCLQRPRLYLQGLLGCITAAVAYCHENRVRHRDIKPQNILLSPDRVYLTDFGISEHLKDTQSSLAPGGQLGTPAFRAPEVRDEEEYHHMKPADIFSLGVVFLSIAVRLYGDDHQRFKLTGLDDIKRRSNMIWCLKELREREQVHFGPEESMSLLPKHILRLVEDMLAVDPDRRPTAADVSERLVELGGIDQVYHGSCCKRPTSEVSRIVEQKFSNLMAANLEQQRRITELERRHEDDVRELESVTATKNNYSRRLDNQEIHVNGRLQGQLEHKTKQLAEATKTIQTLEAELATLRAAPRRRRPEKRGRTPSPQQQRHHPKPGANRPPPPSHVNGTARIPASIWAFKRSSPPLNAGDSKIPRPTSRSSSISGNVTPNRRPTLPRKIDSNNSTLVSSVHSSSSQSTTLLASSVTSMSSIASSPPESPTQRRLEEAVTKQLAASNLTVADPDANAEVTISPAAKQAPLLVTQRSYAEIIKASRAEARFERVGGVEQRQKLRP